MATQDDRWRTRKLRLAAVTFAIGFGIHGLDHLRRGMDASPRSIMIGGTVQAAFVAVAVLMAVTHRYRAPEAAVGIGFGSAAVFVYAHLLPTFWADYQDSYISLPHTGVTWFSWLSAITEIGTGLVYGFVGVGVLRARRSPSALARFAASSSGTAR
ncbi:hypothetical protein AB0I35_17575 [Nocardia sp. NPDC050378]|uniref:hypothetical protein n=1 Tax=Nocardia sp. NPDC050378 TaxID=3155400 RepID=UPI0033E88BD1